MQSKILAEPVLVGREQELTQLENYLELASKGRGSTVFISGEAGAGKTKLAAEFLNIARKQGATVLSGWCLSNTAVPYFPFFEAFNAYFTREETGEAANITTLLRGPSQVDDLGKLQMYSPQVWKDQTFAAVTRTLLSISATETVVLFIDDLHWADSASLALIHYIARAILNEKVLIVATFRREEITDDTEGKPHPLTETLRLMRREDLISEVKVECLNQKSISELAENMLGGQPESELAQRLSEESQGNPLFVVESLRMLHERKEIVQDNDKWRLTSRKLGIPAKIKDIILQRLSCLIHEQRKMVEVASVIGEKFDANLLASVLNQDLSEVIEILDRIGQTTSLFHCEGDFYQFDHSRTRDAVYEELSPALKRVYHAKVATKLVRISKNGKLPYGELAYHYAQAGENENAVKYALTAGEDALRRWSNAEAIKHLTYVMQIVGEDPNRVADRENTLEKLGDSYYANSMFKDAIAIFENIAKTSSNGALKVRVFRKAMEAVFQYGDMTRLMELAKEAEPFAAADRLENARILGSKGRSFALQGNYPAAIENWEKALQVFEEEYSLWDVAWALIGTGGQHAIYALTEQQKKKGLAESLRSIAIFQDIEDSRWLMEAYFVLGLAFSLCLLDHEALDIFAKAIEIDEKMKMGDYLRQVYTHATAARSYWISDDYESALACSLKALEIAKKTDSAVAHAMVYSNLTLEYAILGDMNRSTEFFEKLMKFPPEILIHRFVEIDFPKPVFLAANNQWDESNQIFEETIERFKHVQPTFPMAALLRFKHLYAWALEKHGCFNEAKTIRDERSKAIHETEKSFACSDPKAHIMARSQVGVCEEFEMRVDCVNVGRKPTTLIKIENLLTKDLTVTSMPPWCTLRGNNIEMQNQEIGPFQVNTAKFTLKIMKSGTITLHPKAVYINNAGKEELCPLDPLNITANPAEKPEKVPGKILTGTPDLDHLLLGGLPENYSVVLTSQSSDERALLIQRFLEAGAKSEETTFYVTGDTTSGKALAEKYPSNFNLFICNPQAEAISQNMPNVYKLKGVENLTDIDIALTKAFRTINTNLDRSKRICLEIISDVLLQHHPVNTRRWLNGLLSTLKIKSFTILAVVDPTMHPAEELQAVLSVFDGEIRVYEKETPEGTKQTLRIKRLVNQKYSDKEILLDKEKMAS